MPCWHLALYDDFAWFYNRYWNEEFHGLAFPILERIWLPRVVRKGRILDVCCGTGHLAGLLTARGYRVTGIDVSAEMIALARENVPAAEFHVADASQFKVLGKFDGAVSTFDSLNHLLTEDALQSAFQCTAAALKRGAPFAFQSGISSFRAWGSKTAPERIWAPISAPFSMTQTDVSRPFSAASCFRRIAAERPAGPPPTTTTS